MIGEDYLVSVCMITYNHDKYIQQAIDGVFLQCVNFEYELIIANDGSNDKTHEVITEYLLRHPERHQINYIKNEFNVGPTKNVINAFNHCTGKYIALCEGDDYWTDSFKLQKQVDFLEANPEFGLVYTGAHVVNSKNELIYTSNDLKPSGNVFLDLLKDAFIIACTVCVRNNILKPLNERAYKENLWYVMDYWYWVHCAMQSEVHYIQEATSAYRSHEFGITKNKEFFFQKRIPLIVLDIVKSRLALNNPVSFSLAFLLSRDYNSAMLARWISFKEKRKFLYLIKEYPWLIFGFIPALVNKLLNRVNLALKK